MQLHFEVLVEERSAEAALESLMPKLIGQADSLRIRAFRGKQHLLRALPQRLRGYAAWLTEAHRLVVLVDRDREDCSRLKQELDDVARSVGLKPGQNVINRLAIEELESWFFGDVEALRTVFPRLPPTLAKRSRFRNPDRVVGGTWEALERLLNKHGHHQGGLQKVRLAREIAPHMVPSRNRSTSFRVFREGVERLRAASL